MAKEIKQRIVLEGEKEYNQAINEAKRNLKTLRSELKAETAELGANATAQQKNEARAKSLKEQIKEQEKIVQTLREALKEAQKEYGDNADVVATWEQKLNEARATLGNMKNDLERTGAGFKTLQGEAAQTVVATKAVADSLEKVGESAGKIADTIQGVFTTVLDQITAAAGKVWELIATTAAKANNWTDLASYYGSSADEIQMWNRSIEAAGGSFEDFIAIVNQMAYGGKTKSITETLGISREKYQDDIQYTLAVLDKLQQKKEELSQNDFDTLMEDLFSRKSRQYMWFLSNAQGHEDQNGNWINGWRDNPERWSGQGTYGVSEEGLSNLNDVYIKMQEIDQQWDAIKSKVAEGLGTAALNITTSVSGILEGLGEYMDVAADDPEKDQKRAAALEKIRKNMESFFTAVGQIIRDSIGILNEVGKDLQNSDDPATRLIGDIMVKLSEALQWITEHQEEVVIALQAIFGAWLVARIAALAGKLSGFVANIETIKRLKNFTPPSTGTGTGTGVGGAQTVTTETVSSQTVSQATVANMVVQNMVGGPGTTPATQPVVNNPTVPQGVQPQLLVAGGGAAALPAGNSAKEVLNGANPARLTGEVGNVSAVGGTQSGTPVTQPRAHYDFVGEGTVGEAEAVTAASKIGFGGIDANTWGMRVGERTADIATNPYTVAALSLLLGAPLYSKAKQGASTRDAIEEAYGEAYTEASSGEKLMMEDGLSPEMAKVMSAGRKYTFLDDVTLWVKHAFEDSAEWISDAWDEFMNGSWLVDTLDSMHKLNQVAAEYTFDEHDDEDYDYHSAPDYDTGYYGDDWSLDDILKDMGGALPSSWLAVAGNWNRYSTQTPNENGVSGGDMKGLPAELQKAAKDGVSEGVKGLRVEIDGQVAGRILTPYVSENIARDIG